MNKVEKAATLYAEGKTRQQIARALKIKLSTVSSYISKGKGTATVVANEFTATKDYARKLLTQAEEFRANANALETEAYALWGRIHYEHTEAKQ